jgi:hypothetical protein
VRKDRPTFDLWLFAARHSFSELEEYCRTDEKVCTQLTTILGDRKKGVPHLLNAGLSVPIVNQAVCDVIDRISLERDQARTHLETNPDLIHKGITCDGCDFINFVGLRFKCMQCNDYDLCETCHTRRLLGHDSRHEFLQIPHTRRKVSISS